MFPSSTEELDERGEVLVKQLKNRYNSASTNRKFIIGIDRPKMKLSDISHADQEELSESNQHDTGVVGNGFDFRPKKFEKETASGWKI